jgi:coproporphyrinogen III oxidase
MNNTDRFERAASLFELIQDHICSALEIVDGQARFQSDRWEKDETDGITSGGGVSRVIANGAVIEKGGVNLSKVGGVFEPALAERLGLPSTRTPFRATGVSLVIHPRNPMVPTTHANWRFIEAGERWWFGGGSDLTPYYLFAEDAVHFHEVLRNICDTHDATYYERFKKWCDEYFYLPHRKEHRGIGGIFFDYLGKDGGVDFDPLLSFVRELGFGFPDQYVPIVQRRYTLPFTENDRRFQLLRRGRYVEFNLLYDRGTQFGIQTGGRTESILMSLPPTVCWEYNFEPKDDPRQIELMHVVRTAREWLCTKNFSPH